jgi:hypothetical protein
MVKRIYGELKSPKDVVKIANLIRRDVRRASSREALLELYKRAAYLVTLTHPNRAAARKAWGKKIYTMHEIAKREFTKTAKLINKKIPGKKLDEYWG